MVNDKEKRFEKNLRKMLYTTAVFCYKESGIKYLTKEIESSRRKIVNTAEQAGYLIIMMGSILASYGEFNKIAKNYEERNKRLTIEQKVQDNYHTSALNK